MSFGFYNTYSIASGILKIFLLLIAGYLLYKKGLVKRDAVDGLSNILIWACIPALIFTRITSTFDPFEFTDWWILPVSSIAMSFAGLTVGYIFQRPIKNFRPRREFMSACAFQNSGYLPMTLVAFVCSGPFCDRLLVYIFLFLLGFNISVWSFTPAFLSRRFMKNFKPSSILNPPVIITIFAIFLVFVSGRGRVHNLISDPLRMLGDSSFPLSLIALGAYLAEHKGVKSDNWLALASCVLAKLICLPAAVFILVRFLPLSQALKFFILLEAMMPSAVSLILIGQYANADNKFLSSVIFYSHLLSIVTIPIWLLVISKIL